jgi:two-component system NtrC family sensor kinase
VLELSEELPRARCDPAQLEQALLALCINAVEAMPHGGRLTVTTGQDESGKVVLEVGDDGAGIDPEVVPHIFEPFYTTKGEGDSKGLGLGLAVVYGIVQRHNGSIEVDSQPGRGTRMTVTLPLEGVPSEEGGE